MYCMWYAYSLWWCMRKALYGELAEVDEHFGFDYNQWPGLWMGTAREVETAAVRFLHLVAWNMALQAARNEIPARDWMGRYVV